jgi:hypothetical protein
VLVNYYHPILDSNGEIVSFITNIFTATSLTSQLQFFVKNIEGAEAYIIEMGTRNIVASSDATAALLTVDSVTNTATMIDVRDYTNVLISESAKELLSKYGNMFEHLDRDNINELRYFSKARGNAVWCDAQYLNGGDGLDWVLVLSISQHEFVGRYISAVSAALGISAVIGVGGLIIAVIAAYLIAKPLVSIVKEISYLEDMELDQIAVHPISIFAEIASIQGNFYTVVRRLIEYKAFLPSSVLQRDYGVEDVHEVESDFPIEKRSSVASIQESHSNSTTTSSHLAYRHFALGLESSDSCTLTAKLNGFNTLFQVYSPSEAVNWYGRVLEAVERCARISKGVLIHFDTNEFVIHWTSHAPSRHMLHCAQSMSEVIHNLIHQSGTSETDLSISIAVVFALTRYGNIGNKNMRKFCVLGPSPDISKKLATLSSKLKIGVVICDSLKIVNEKQFITRPIGYIKTESGSVLIHQNMGRKESINDEWMYEMERDKKHNQHEPYCNAFAFMEEKEYGAAFTILEELVESDPTDPLKKRLFELCQQAIQESCEHPKDLLTISDV